MSVIACCGACSGNSVHPSPFSSSAVASCHLPPTAQIDQRTTETCSCASLICTQQADVMWIWMCRGVQCLPLWSACCLVLFLPFALEKKLRLCMPAASLQHCRQAFCLQCINCGIYIYIFIYVCTVHVSHCCDFLVLVKELSSRQQDYHTCLGQQLLLLLLDLQTTR